MAAVGEQDASAFGGIDRRASTDTDEQIDQAFPCQLGRLETVNVSRVGWTRSKTVTRKPGAFEVGDDSRGNSKSDDARSVTSIAPVPPSSVPVSPTWRATPLPNTARVGISKRPSAQTPSPRPRKRRMNRALFLHS